MHTHGRNGQQQAEGAPARLRLIYIRDDGLHAWQNERQPHTIQGDPRRSLRGSLRILGDTCAGHTGKLPPRSGHICKDEL